MSFLPVREDRKWYYLGLRHLRMSSRLMRSGFADGAVFHAYHGYECLLSAFIAAKGYPVPPEGWTTLRLPSGKIVHAYPSPHGVIQDHNAHKARLVFFDQLADRTESYYTNFRRLGAFLIYQDRLDALYYNAGVNLLPEHQYSASFAAGLLTLLMQCARDIRIEIP